MAFTTVQTGDTVEASHVQELQNEITAGTIPLVVTGVNDSTAYAADFQNLDATNGYTLRARDNAGNTILTLTRVLATFGKKVSLVLGSFTAAVATNMFAISATWNQGATVFKGIYVTITNTASAATSRLLDLQVGGVTMLDIDLTGAINAARGVMDGTVSNLTHALWLSPTFSNAGVAFRGIMLQVTNTASAATSRLLDLQVGGVSKFDIDISGSVKISTPIACKVYMSAPQAINNASATDLLFDTESFDYDTIHAVPPAGNTERLTCKTAGEYHISGNVIFADSAVGWRLVDLILNNAGSIGKVSAPGMATGGPFLSVNLYYQLVATDYVTLRVTQDSGGALNVTDARFMMSRIV